MNKITAKSITRPIIEKLLQYEMDVANPPDARRLMTDERCAVMAAWRRGPYAGLAREKEAMRVLRMWRDGVA